MLESFIIAFSMYSRIPMPRVNWTERGMKYSMCFFPLVGAVIGMCNVGVFYGMQALSFGRVCMAVFLTALPVLLNGGIHMDGFLDTVDARRSYKPKEERLKILKDPHAGAFAIIYGGVYFLLMFGLFCEIEATQMTALAFGYVYSRILSGLSVVAFPKAKKEGTVAAFADAAQKRVKGILIVQAVVCGAVWIWVNPLYGIVCMAVGALVFVYYYFMSKKQFGGITGDLAGYFLQLCELLELAAVVAAGKAALLL